jgi:O-acetyl-ADP-ribose deacetylase (regulator of RNase III)
MPLIKRSEVDMLRLAPFTDLVINPVSLSGRMSAGLAKAIADQWPAMAEEYHTLCEQGQLAVGQLHIYYDPTSKNTIINMLVKKDWRDQTTIEDIESCCIQLATYLQQHPFHTAMMPAFGTNSGKLDPVFAEEVLLRHLDPLPNIIHLSMRPDRFVRPPRYLVVVGDRNYADFDRIDIGVGEALIEFGLHWGEFDALVSGGARGVDKAAAGTGKPGDTEQTVAKAHGLRPIVCQADWERYGNSAGFVRNRTMADIGTHFVAYVAKESVGTKMMIGLIKRLNEQIDQQLASLLPPTGGDVFDRPYIVPPEKKRLIVYHV